MTLISPMPPLVGQSPQFLSALEHVSAAAPLDRPVLVVGERGVGKELAAARLHYLSPRWDGPYIKLNCAAISESLLESELFGHEAGAFTGATRKHIGRFERAEGGTLFLDEIASASMSVQEKILRVIEYGEFERVGGGETLDADVRIVAAANVDLPERAARQKFRADLLDRLAFDVITLPPLRVRWEDIPILAFHFGQRMAASLGASHFPGFGMRAMGALMNHDWPGNVRELKNVVERAVYRSLSQDDAGEVPINAIQIDPFESPWRLSRQSAVAEAEVQTGPPEMTARPIPDGTCDFKALTESYEAALVEKALDLSDGHQGKAAEHLSLTYHQFRNLLRKHNISAHRFRT